MDKLDAMIAFTKVVALGSFAEAARALRLTRSAVSKAVSELERVLGVRLLERTTRRVGVTEAGRAYYERCLDILARLEETELQVSRLHTEPKGILKINAPMSFGAQYLAPAIAAFMTRHPGLKIEITLNDRFIDPIEEGVDVTVRIADLADSSLVARKLATARMIIVASPAYIARHRAPLSPEDLAKHTCLVYGHTTSGQRWTLTRGGVPVSVVVTSRLCANNGEILRAAAVAGEGIALLPAFIVGHDIADGRLQPLLSDFPVKPLGIYALYTPNRYLAAKTRMFIDFLSERFGDTPPWERA